MPIYGLKVTPEEEALGELLALNKEVLSEAACTLFDEAYIASYADYLAYNYCVQQGEYEEAMQKMSLEATRLTDSDREHLAKIVRAGEGAASSIDPDDETPAGYRYCRGDVHYYYQMTSEIVDVLLQVAWWAKVNQMIGDGGLTGLTHGRPKTSESSQINRASSMPTLPPPSWSSGPRRSLPTEFPRPSWRASQALSTALSSLPREGTDNGGSFCTKGPLHGTPLPCSKVPA
jgi:hypothetical protein